MWHSSFFKLIVGTFHSLGRPKVFPHKLCRQSQYLRITEREGLKNIHICMYLYIYICIFLLVLCHVVSVWHGLVKALTVSNDWGGSAGCYPVLRRTHYFCRPSLWSRACSVSQNLKCLRDHGATRHRYLTHTRVCYNSIALSRPTTNRNISPLFICLFGWRVALRRRRKSRRWRWRRQFSGCFLCLWVERRWSVYAKVSVKCWYDVFVPFQKAIQSPRG